MAKQELMGRTIGRIGGMERMDYWESECPWKKSRACGRTDEATEGVGRREGEKEGGREGGREGRRRDIDEGREIRALEVRRGIWKKGKDGEDGERGG
jgi:hypothetical protein